MRGDGSKDIYGDNMGINDDDEDEEDDDEKDNIVDYKFNATQSLSTKNKRETGYN